MKKDYDVRDTTIYSMGISDEVDFKMVVPLDFDPLTKTECGGFIFTKSDSLLEVFDGNTHNFSYKSCSGDRSWNDWSNRRPASPGSFGMAFKMSRGGGLWEEVVITPKNGVVFSYEQKIDADFRGIDLFEGIDEGGVQITLPIKTLRNIVSLFKFVEENPPEEILKVLDEYNVS